jgi:16S rRNA (cytosine1402-N4)-methyltransferase
MEMKHFPVLLNEVLTYLNPKEGDSYLDLTGGYGGHAGSILERTLHPERATLVDRDQNAIIELQKQFQGSKVEIIHKDFKTAAQELNKAGKKFDLILADLGVSSPHLDNASRGFSIKLDGPLDMRMDVRQSLTAKEVVNSYDEAELADILRRYGEEPRANKIARLIVEHRPIATTKQLAEIAAHAWPGHSRVHPATRTFQALRVAVNDELDLLERALPVWIDLLAPGGRIVIISFHSLEDRIVKRAFAETTGNRYDAILTLLTKQPITGSPDEIVYNPRARSAKLRAAVKIKTKERVEANADSGKKPLPRVQS